MSYPGLLAAPWHTCVDGCLLVLCVVVVQCHELMAYAGR
jgi:hypothetical protein